MDLISPQQTREAVVAGHICLDILPTMTGGAVVFAPGRSIEVGKALLSTGGPVSNTGLALHVLGVSTNLIGKVGNDLFGEAILQIVEGYDQKLAEGMVVVPGEASSYTIILSPPGTDRCFIHFPGCNDTFSAADIDYHRLNNVALFHFGYPPAMARMYQQQGAELVSIFTQARERGVTTSLDLCMPDPSAPAGQADWQSILTAVTPYVDVFLPSIEELLLLLRRPLFEKLSARAGKASILELIAPEVVSELGTSLLKMGAGIVGLKVGERGFYLRTANLERLEQMGRAMPPHLHPWANRELWAPCFETQVVGTTGSGDATIAGFLMGLLRGMGPEEALAAACAVGACNVEAADSISGLRPWPETMERIAAGWPRKFLTRKRRPELDMAASGWRWNAINEVWIGPADGQS